MRCPTCEGAGEVWVDAPERARCATLDILAMPDMVDDARLTVCPTCWGSGSTPTTTEDTMTTHEQMMTEAREMGSLAGEQCAPGETWVGEDILPADAALLRQMSGDDRIPSDVVDAYHTAASAADGAHRE